MQWPRSARYGAERVIRNLVVYGEDDGLALHVASRSFLDLWVEDEF